MESGLESEKALAYWILRGNAGVFSDFAG